MEKCIKNVENLVLSNNLMLQC